MPDKRPPKDLIIQTLAEKGCLKQNVYRLTQDIFKEFKEVLEEVKLELHDKMCAIDDEVTVEFVEKGENHLELKFGGDVLIFYMHTNVFSFDKSHSLWQTSYVQEDPLRAYSGMINVYNFLADSFKYNRVNDSGYLIARVFVNKDRHYFVEGKRQLGFLYNNFITDTIDKQAIRSIIESAILYSLDFDLLTPPYANVSEVTVYELQEESQNTQMRTGKRLGFRFQSDDDHIG